MIKVFIGEIEILKMFVTKLTIFFEEWLPGWPHPCPLSG